MAKDKELNTKLGLHSVEHNKLIPVIYRQELAGLEERRVPIKPKMEPEGS